MKKIIKIILLSFFGFAYNSSAQKPTVEQLMEKLSQQKKTDTAHINLLNELARRPDISTSMRDSVVNKSLQLSRDIEYTTGEAMALIAEAQYADKDLAGNISKQAIALAEKSGDKRTLFRAYRSLIETSLYTSENVKAIDACNKALALANDMNDPELIISAQLAYVDYYKNVKVNYPVALEWGLKALQVAEKYHDKQDLPGVYRNIGLVYLLIGEQEKSLFNMQKALAASRETGDIETAQFTLNDIGERYRMMNKYPEALKAYAEAAQTIKDPFNLELNESNVADVYQRMGNDSLCFIYAFRSLTGAKELNDTIGISWIDNILSRAYLHTGKTDSAIHYAAQGYQYAIQTLSPEFIRDNSEALSNAFTVKKNFEQALSYYRIYISSRDSMLNNEISNKTNLAQYNYDLEKKQAEIAVLNKDKQLQHYFLIGTIAILLFIVISLIILYRNNNKRKKAYALLHEQKQEIQLQRDQTNQALTDLKLTQTQLIQSEKMASLGELTAGIAHEIQNPLNFVNNFSEVSNELIEELKTEKSKPKSERNDQLEEELLNDISQNLEKINHHGKRADSIVKGMLQHSRSSSSTKELTDINDLADEYLRLSYHGLRAKDKSFNATMKTNFAIGIEEINIIPQEIGRVILNLLTNAFYAVNEKRKMNIPGYEPTVSVSTKKINNKIEISIADNGNGIPSSIKDKIFQPFFTTKPTGQGTGLGLSLSYDIVKAHGGKINIHTKSGEGSEFIIELPYS